MASIYDPFEDDPYGNASRRDPQKRNAFMKLLMDPSFRASLGMIASSTLGGKSGGYGAQAIYDVSQAQERQRREDALERERRFLREREYGQREREYGQREREYKRDEDYRRDQMEAGKKTTEEKREDLKRTRGLERAKAAVVANPEITYDQLPEDVRPYVQQEVFAGAQAEARREAEDRKAKKTTADEAAAEKKRERAERVLSDLLAGNPKADVPKSIAGVLTPEEIVAKRTKAKEVALDKDLDRSAKRAQIAAAGRDRDTTTGNEKDFNVIIRELVKGGMPEVEARKEALNRTYKPTSQGNQLTYEDATRIASSIISKTDIAFKSPDEYGKAVFAMADEIMKRNQSAAPSAQGGSSQPKVGDTKVFPSGKKGRWDGKGWELVQ